MRKNISMILKFVIVICSCTGIVLACMAKKSLIFPFMFFTNLSNSWIGTICFLIFVLNIIELKIKKEIIPRWLYILKYVFTVSITITGVVFCILLAPTAGELYNPWNLESVLVHIIVPLVSIVDFFIDPHRFELKTNYMFFSLFPLLTYFAFTVIGYIANFDFGYGYNYPYFFLNWGSPLGAFKISQTQAPYIGTFYWILIIFMFVLCVSYIYILIKKLIQKSD